MGHPTIVLECGLGAECGPGDARAAVVAEDGRGVDGVAACVAVCGACGCAALDGGAEDLAGDEHGLHGVELADTSGHEEGFDPADDHGDTGP